MNLLKRLFLAFFGQKLCKINQKAGLTSEIEQFCSLPRISRQQGLFLVILFQSYFAVRLSDDHVLSLISAGLLVAALPFFYKTSLGSYFAGFTA